MIAHRRGRSLGRPPAGQQTPFVTPAAPSSSSARRNTIKFQRANGAGIKDPERASAAGRTGERGGTGVRSCAKNGKPPEYPVLPVVVLTVLGV